MTPERWQEVQDVLEKALELAPSDRFAFLNRACSSDPSLRQEVETLLASRDDLRSSFLQAPSSSITLAAGTKLGDYEVKSLLGAGGMGEVYRARDARLGRDVAIKVLPSFLCTDSERLRRFEQEARAAAALNHPNILAVFQMGTYEGAPYLVSELLEGETLREQITRGRMTIRKAIDYGIQIARGLAAAHEKGVVHRDLKPENLFATKDGRVKILDFGLAKLMQPQSSSEHDAPTLTEGTEAGVVMGTVGYMAPEQVRGEAADHRADVFAFGAILYEMLAGKRAFQKPTSPETMAAILNEDPPGISQVTTNVPPALQRVVHRCLEKNPEQRFQSASDLAFALDALSETSINATAFLKKDPWRISKVFAVAAVLLALVAAGVTSRFLARRAHQKYDLVERRLTATPSGSSISSWTISRDGKYLAYGDFTNKLYLLAIDSGEIREMTLPAAYQPEDWFPDGNHLLVADGAIGELWKMSTWDSSLRKLWSGAASATAISPDGSRIAFVKDDTELWLMGDEGEDPHKVLGSDAGQFPEVVAWSPAGRRLAYVRLRGTTADPEMTIETCDLSGQERTVVLSNPLLLSANGVSDIAWLPDGRIVYSISSKESESTLWTIRTDPSTGKPNGNPTRLIGWNNFQTWNPQASSDGNRLVVAREHIESAIYIGDLAFGKKGFTPRRFTPDDWYNVVADWSKDSKAIFFHSKRNGRWSIFKQNIDAKTPEALITGSENYFWPRVSAKGTLLYSATASSDRNEPRDTTIRLMSTPEQGGARSTLMMGRYEYACGSSPLSSCVGSDLTNGQLIFFSLDPEAGRGEELARLAGFQSPSATGLWDLSPDGTRLVIADHNEAKGEIRILNLTDRRFTILPIRDWKWSSIVTISWAADGKGWFALAQSGSSFLLISIDANGNPRVLREMPVGAAWVSSLVPSPDGRSLAFTMRVFKCDVMLLENF
jgi:eukaryotic-like serine/threonine-protein kinase